MYISGLWAIINVRGIIILKRAIINGDMYLIALVEHYNLMLFVNTAERIEHISTLNELITLDCIEVTDLFWVSKDAGLLYKHLFASNNHSFVRMVGFHGKLLVACNSRVVCIVICT